MRVNKAGFGKVVTFVAGSLVASVASAAVIGPGAVEFPTQVQAPPSGTLEASVLLPFVSSPSGDITGTVLSQVFSGDTNNPHGGLTFVYQVANNQQSDHSISRLTASSFDGFITDVSYMAGSGVAPAFADRSVTGEVIGFSFHPAPLGSGSVHPGLHSTVLMVRTNAQSYVRASTSAINGEVANVTGFAPIPEPGTLSLLAAAGLMMIRRRR